MEYKNYIIKKTYIDNDYYVVDLKGNVIFSRQDSIEKCKNLIDNL